MSDVLERFLRYVQVDSQSNAAFADQTPSTACQHDMARVLAADLLELGCEDARADEHAYVTATVPASAGCEHLPALGLLAHIDSTTDAPGFGVKPHIVHYEGGNLVSGVVDGKVIETTPEDAPNLRKLVGQDIVVSDGTTLLSADDKGGVAEIVSLVARLREHPELPHPTLKIGFVPDEEIGHGASLLDIEEFGAAWAYTLDGGFPGEINWENFSAASATVKVYGTQVHPGDAKGVMVNALTLLRQFDEMLPQDQRPENTEGYEGYFHLHSASGTPSFAESHYLIRDFDSDKFEARKQLVRDAAAYMNARYGEGRVEVTICEQYRNMAEHIRDKMFLIDNAIAANAELGIESRVEPARGGTDGAQLTYRGLPCPNLAMGGQQGHSIREFIAVSSLESGVDFLERLVAKFAVEQ